MSAVITDVPSANGKAANEESDKDTLGAIADSQSLKSQKKPKLYNVVAAKKAVSQGLMDVALMTSNANQLRYVLQFGYNTRTYPISIALILLSILLQVCVGILLLFKGRTDVLVGHEKKRHAHEMTKLITLGVFSVTVINVFIASFTEFGEEPKIDLSIINNYLSTAF